MEIVMAKSIVFGSLGAILVVGAVTIATAAPANAVCRGFKEATARGILQTPTEILARNRWRGEVRSSYGIRFTQWSNAKDKTMRCRKLLPGRRWHCVARARPCDR
jgi:hypothetical protein